jgi:hypothetical protein
LTVCSQINHLANYWAQGGPHWLVCISAESFGKGIFC